MTIGLTEHIDLALISLYAFWIFFFVLVAYLQREGMREGYPQESETSGERLGGGLVGLPSPKTFRVSEGGQTYEYTAPHPEPFQVPEKALHVDRSGGSPLEPVGDPMLSEFGPAAYAERADRPAMTFHNDLKIAPLRNLEEFAIVEGDQDPRGLPVIAADKGVAGEVVDVWIDREEQLIRYLEVRLGEVSTAAPAAAAETPRAETMLPGEEPDGAAAPAPAPSAAAAAPTGDTVLLPMTMAVVGGRWARMGLWRPEVQVSAIFAKHFADVPRLANPNQVTLLEEDKITAYYGGGTLYAHPARREPLI